MTTLSMITHTHTQKENKISKRKSHLNKLAVKLIVRDYIHNEGEYDKE